MMIVIVCVVAIIVILLIAWIYTRSLERKSSPPISKSKKSEKTEKKAASRLKRKKLASVLRKMGGMKPSMLTQKDLPPVMGEQGSQAQSDEDFDAELEKLTKRLENLSEQFKEFDED